MTQAEKDKLIKELQEKLAEAEKIEVDKPKRWKPEYDETYWLVDYDGNICHSNWSNDPADEWCYRTGNCFKTREEAEEYQKQIEYTARYKNYIEEHDDDVDLSGFGKGTIMRFYAKYNLIKDEISVDLICNFKIQGAIYASSEQVIWDAINEIGEDNFKKYVLGVK